MALMAGAFFWMAAHFVPGTARHIAGTLPAA
jgi:hypothetical protein